MDDGEDVLSQDGEGDLLAGDKQNSEESSEITASEDEAPWISWFINLRGNDFFCEVEESFIQDDFNLTGLSPQVPFYDFALDMILDVEIPVEKLTEDQHEIIETAADVLYGLIHARYILTAAGMQKMLEKFQNVDFGRCPRSFCHGQPVLPVGLSDVTREFSVEVFCPQCHQTYHPRSSKHSNLDGAYFGTTFCHLFLLTHPELIVPKAPESYVPRIFGFRINESSHYYKLRESAPAQGKRRNSKNGGSNKAESAVVRKGRVSAVLEPAVVVTRAGKQRYNREGLLCKRFALAVPLWLFTRSSSTRQFSRALPTVLSGARPGTTDPGNKDQSPAKERNFMSEISEALYLPGAAALADMLDSRISVLLHDGRYLVGFLRSYDQYLNLVLHKTVERYVAKDCFSETEIGVFVVRGENIICFGEVQKDLPLELVSVEEVRERAACEANQGADWEVE